MRQPKQRPLKNVWRGDSRDPQASAVGAESRELRMDQFCEKLIRKFCAGQHLNDAEKAHVADCERCIIDIMRHLDAVKERKNGEAADNNSERIRAEARHALEHGRRVFEREFGISFTKE